MAERTFLILGCGTSVGVPMIGCSCPVCASSNLRNHRTRASVLIQTARGNILIDTSPELRLQFVREKIDVCHAVLYTHYHADHLFGLDDVRIFPRRIGGALPIYCTDETEEVIRQAFSYAFHPGADDLPAGILPKLTFRRITTEPFEVLGETVTPVPLIHAKFNCLGFRIGNVAYCTDVSAIPEASYDRLQNLDVLILDALRPKGFHPSHFSLKEALATVDRLKPRRTILTHMSHEMDYDELKATLPAGVEPGYDGLRFEF